MKNLPRSLKYRLITEAALISGTLLIVFLWYSARLSEQPGLSLLFLGLYMLLDQINSRFWVWWQENLLEKHLGKNERQ